MEKSASTTPMWSHGRVSSSNLNTGPPSFKNRVSQQRAMVCSFISEYTLPSSIAPHLIKFAQALASDHKALQAISMERFCATYKSTHGVHEVTRKRSERPVLERPPVVHGAVRSAKSVCEDVRYDRVDHYSTRDTETSFPQRCKLEGCTRKSQLKCQECGVVLCVTGKNGGDDCFYLFHHSACSCQRTKTAEVRRLKRRVKILKTRVRVVKLEADVDRSRILTLHERCSALKEDLCKGKSENFDLKSKVHSYNLDISKMRICLLVILHQQQLSSDSSDYSDSDSDPEWVPARSKSAASQRNVFDTMGLF
ncbi:hypothetical protein RRG08_043014 [Elysia crispata]|uniref:Uncharacterized protein n=1 Tax=Elysia crispata TaxID=231223 RepID=A0AAE0XXX1_9GAST|nr:hypothetical protein RRG08_043014 [Elysia crispata]